MDLKDKIIKVCEGNPGCLNVLCESVKHIEKEYEENYADRVFLFFASLEQLRISGCLP